jgi:Ribosomal protein L14E/L6E/L27E
LSDIDLKRGQLVVSKMGRDKGNLFVVIHVQSDRFVFIADGKYHSVRKPKKKSVKHLIVIQQVNAEIAETLEKNLALTDEQVASALRGYQHRERKGDA